MSDSEDSGVSKVLVLVKPEAVRGGQIGLILSYFDKANFHVEDIKMVCPTRELIELHYPPDPEWLAIAGGHWIKAQETLREQGTPALGPVHTNAVDAGEHLRELLVLSYADQPVVAVAYSAKNAVATARKICGSTDPSVAAKGTIRGDLGDDSGLQATAEDRPIQNKVHVSSSDGDAERELQLWFGN